MTPERFRYLVIEPVTELLDMNGKAADDLLLGTAILESNIEFVQQIGGGPALSLFQVEPSTLFDCYQNYLNYREDLMNKVDSLLFGLPTPGNRERNLMINPHYACAIARIVYRRKPQALPKAEHGKEDYIKGLAAYWKQHYNTLLGAGTIEKAEKVFASLI